jgi:hypothetical protein
VSEAEHEPKAITDHSAEDTARTLQLDNIREAARLIAEQATTNLTATIATTLGTQTVKPPGWWLDRTLSFGTLVTLLGIFWASSSAWARMESRVQTLEEWKKETIATQVRMQATDAVLAENQARVTENLKAIRELMQMHIDDTRVRQP